MTTLKYYYADEIASAFDAQLKDPSFIGMYKKADMALGSPAFTRFTTELPKAADVVVGAKLWNETASDFKTEPDEGAQARAIWTQKFPGTQPPAAQKADDAGEREAEAKGGCSQHAEKQDGCANCQAEAKDGCSQHAETQDGCPECADAAGLAIAVDFAIKHVTKVADALDKAGFVGVAEALDETLRKLAAARPIVMFSSGSMTKKAATIDELKRRFEEDMRTEGIRPPNEKADPAQYNRLFNEWRKSNESEEGLGADETRTPAPAAGTVAPANPNLPTLTDDMMAMWNALPGPMREQVLPGQSGGMPTAFMLTNPEVQQRLKNRYDQWNRMQLGQKTPPPQAGRKRVETAESRVIKLVQRVLGTKPDGVWGPITAGAWNTYVKGSPHMKGWEMYGVDTKDKQAPSVETMNSFIQKATGKSPAEVGKGPHGAPGI